MPNKNIFTCPVCGYDRLNEPAYDEHGCSSFSICPCCGTEFGYDDSTVSHEVLRKRWIVAGMRWWSTSVKPPVNWNPRNQLDCFTNMIDITQLINIPRRSFQKLSMSMYDLLKETGYFENGIQISEQDVYDALVLRPELADDWMQYSEDKRCSGWYFKRNNKTVYLVGCLNKNGTIETEYDDKLMACAVFIKRELDQISSRRRAQ